MNIQLNSKNVEVKHGSLRFISEPSLKEMSMILADTPVKTNTNYDELDETISLMMDSLGQICLQGVWEDRTQQERKHDIPHRRQTH